MGRHKVPIPMERKSFVTRKWNNMLVFLHMQFQSRGNYDHLWQRLNDVHTSTDPVAEDIREYCNQFARHLATDNETVELLRSLLHAYKVPHDEDFEPADLMYTAQTNLSQTTDRLTRRIRKLKFQLSETLRHEKV